MQLSIEVVTTVQEQVPCGEPGGQIRAPPPVVVFCAQMKVTEQDRSFGARNHQNYKNQEKKSEHVVHLRRPNRIKNEEELNENTAEGQHATHHDTRNGLGVD